MAGKCAFSPCVHQAACTKAIGVSKVGVASSARQSSKLGRSERGDLEWLSGRARPDHSASASLIRRAGPELLDLCQAMKRAGCARVAAKTGVLIAPVGLDRACVVGFADSSSAKSLRLKIQIGALIFFADVRILPGPTPRAPPRHESKRTPRLVRFTLAGEAIVLDLGVYARPAWRRSCRRC